MQSQEDTSIRTILQQRYAKARRDKFILFQMYALALTKPVNSTAHVRKLPPSICRIIGAYLWQAYFRSLLIEYCRSQNELEYFICERADPLLRAIGNLDAPVLSLPLEQVSLSNGVRGHVKAAFLKMLDDICPKSQFCRSIDNPDNLFLVWGLKVQVMPDESFSGSVSVSSNIMRPDKNSEMETFMWSERKITINTYEHSFCNVFSVDDVKAEIHTLLRDFAVRIILERLPTKIRSKLEIA
jgi:hypothetical protein